MDGRNLDVDVVASAVDLFVFDTQVGEMNLLVEVWKVVVARPGFDLGSLPIRAPIGIVTILIPLVQPPLVLTLELVVKNDAINPCLALREVFGFAKVCPIDVGVMFHLARLLEARVERLARLVVAVTTRFQEVPAAVGQHDRHVRLAVQPNRSDEALFAQMSEVAVARISFTPVVIAEVSRSHDAKCADRRQRPSLGPSKGVLALPRVPHDLTVTSPREPEIPRENIPRVAIAIARAAVAPAPVRPRTKARFRLLVARARTTAELRPKIIIPIALVGVTVGLLSATRSRLRLAPAVIAVVVVGAASVTAMPVGAEPLIVTRVRVTRVEIEHVALHRIGKPTTVGLIPPGTCVDVRSQPRAGGRERAPARARRREP
jgi:hypothetical protein